MEITLLGTGTSQGVPVIACECEVCMSNDVYDKRLRSSVMVHKGDTRLVIDAGPDFRQQLLRENVKHLNAILLTHAHKDHIGGLDDVRSFNWVQRKPMDIFAAQEVLDTVKKDFEYAFNDMKYPGVPELALHTVNSISFVIGELKVQPIKAMHHKLPVLGYRIGDFSYLTDANYIETSELDKMRGSKVLVINALRKKKHLSHFNLEEALDVIKKLAPEKAYLTHMSHHMGYHRALEKELPQHVYPGYDGLKIVM